MAPRSPAFDARAPVRSQNPASSATITCEPKRPGGKTLPALVFRELLERFTVEWRTTEGKGDWLPAQNPPSLSGGTSRGPGACPLFPTANREQTALIVKRDAPFVSRSVKFEDSPNSLA